MGVQTEIQMLCFWFFQMITGFTRGLPNSVDKPGKGWFFRLPILFIVWQTGQTGPTG